QSASILSDLTNYTSIILGPEVFKTTLKQIQIISLSDQAAVAILVTSTGHVENRYFNVPVTMQASDLEKLVNILNEKLTGVPIVQLQQKLYGEIAHILQQYSSDFETTYSYLQAALVEKHPVKLYMDGKANIMLQPEFHDIEKIQSFYAAMEEEDEIAKLLRTSGKGLKVSIGQENELAAIQDCSLITATYSLGENQLGTIALLGPTRMEYSRVISLLNVLSKQLTNTFNLWY